MKAKLDFITIKVTRMLEHTVLRKGSIADSAAEELLTMAVFGMDNNSLKTAQRYFTDCSLCFLEDIGELHILHDGNYLFAFCFILDKYDTDRAARHLHIMSVVKSSRGQSLGRQLIERVISTNEGEPITLEALPDSKGFFEKVGFKSKSVSLRYGITAMYLNGDGSDELFKFLTPSAKQLEYYGDRYVENCKRLGMYPNN